MADAPKPTKAKPIEYRGFLIYSNPRIFSEPDVFPFCYDDPDDDQQEGNALSIEACKEQVDIEIRRREHVAAVEEEPEAQLPQHLEHSSLQNLHFIQALDCPWCNQHPKVEVNVKSGRKYGKGRISCVNEDCPVQPVITEEAGDAEDRLRAWNALQA